MGAPCYDLIPPAILLDNPGITKERFMDLLSKTKFSAAWSFRVNAPWNSYGSKFPPRNCAFYCGMHGLASMVLHLDHSSQYKNLNPVMSDEYGLEIRPKVLSISRNVGKRKYNRTEFLVYAHLGNKLGPIKRREYWLEDKPTEGEITSDCMTEEFRVETIHDCEFQGYEEDKARYKCDLTVRPYTELTRIERFRDEKTLIAAHPDLNPNFCYDFSQESGILSPDFIGSKKISFRWIQKDGRYYLDEDYISKNVKPWGNNGLTGLVLTAEAIKNNAWKLLCYDGFKFIQYFLRAFPDSRNRYLGCLNDIFSSRSAELERLSVSEFLRERILNPPATVNFSRKDLVQMIMEESRMFGRTSKHHDSSTQINLDSNMDDEIPF